MTFLFRIIGFRFVGREGRKGRIADKLFYIRENVLIALQPLLAATRRHWNTNRLFDLRDLSVNVAKLL